MLLPEVYIERAEEIDDVHAEDAVDGSVAHEREVRRVFAPYVQSTVANMFSEGGIFRIATFFNINWRYFVFARKTILWHKSEPESQVRLQNGPERFRDLHSVDARRPLLQDPPQREPVARS